MSTWRDCVAQQPDDRLDVDRVAAGDAQCDAVQEHGREPADVDEVDVVPELPSGLHVPQPVGGAIAIIGCHRGFHSGSGAEGVGRAATRAFVSSFIAILALDFFLALFLNNLYAVLWPVG
ncbi:MAG TPA: hypothetical protein DDY78_12130 [Planctomycetales bacterium]|nr:hypothetical protein [Planctomycetales bacterium]